MHQERNTESALPPASPLMPSVTLARFTNVGEHSSGKAIADEITDNLNLALAHFEEFRLVASDSIKNADPVQQNRTAYLIKGSVDLTATQARIVVEMVAAATERPVWTKTFEHAPDDVPTQRKNIIATVASTVGIAVLEEQGRAIAHKADRDLDLNELTIRGMQFLQRLNPEDNQIARRFFDSVIMKAPTQHIPALGLCISFANEIANGWPNGRSDTLEYSLTLASDVLRLHKHSGHAHRTMSCLQFLAGDFPSGLSHAERAYELNPYSSDMILIRGLAFLLNGREIEGLSEMERAVEINPYAQTYFRIYLSLGYYMMDRFEDSLATLDKIENNVAASYILQAMNLVATGKQTEAKAISKILLRENPHFKVGPFVKGLPFANEEYRTVIADTLISTGLPG